MKINALTLLTLTATFILSKSDLGAGNNLWSDSLPEENKTDYSNRRNITVKRNRIKRLKDLPEVVEAVEGKAAILPCQVEKVTNAAYIWIDAQGNILQQTDFNRFSIDGDGNLIIKNAERTDEGIYECVAVNAEKTARKKTRLIVLIAPSVMLFTSAVKTEGAVVEMECISQGQQISSITFERNGTDVVAANEGVSMTQQLLGTAVIANLIFNEVKRGDAGVYICRAVNQHGSDMMPARLTVQYPPLVSTEREQVLAYPGVSVNLTCLVDAEPKAKITWEFQGQVLRGKITYISTGGHLYRSILTISPRNISAFGTYRCVASNGVSSVVDNNSLDNNTWVEIQLQLASGRRAIHISTTNFTPSQNVDPTTVNISTTNSTLSQNVDPTTGNIGSTPYDTFIYASSPFIGIFILVIIVSFFLLIRTAITQKYTPNG